jgi:hypothetical protein
MPSRHIDVEDDAQVRELPLPFGETLKQHASVEECVAREHNLTFGLLEERLNHRVGICRWDAWDVRARNHQVGHKDLIPLPTGDNCLD